MTASIFVGMLVFINYSSKILADQFTNSFSLDIMSVIVFLLITPFFITMYSCINAEFSYHNQKILNFIVVFI